MPGKSVVPMSENDAALNKFGSFNAIMCADAKATRVVDKFLTQAMVAK